jgi:ATPase complex subunit ATP10
MKPSQLLLLRSLAFNIPPRICYSCAKRQFQTVGPLRQKSNLSAKESAPQAQPSPTPSPNPPELPSDPSKFKLQPLGRPIGVPYPPQAGENDPKDRRSISERRADFTNYDKHLERRKELTAAVAKPYFRDWKNLKYAEGKGWIANERLWKREVSLYMPNLVGRTLDKVGDGETGGRKDLVGVMKGRISIVCIFSKTWAENQVKSWISSPEIQDYIKDSSIPAQIIEVNVEEGRLYRAVLKMFEGRLRGMRREEDWDKYFFLTGIPNNVREAIGVMNSKAGYVYLVDGECRIRWAGSGGAEGDEKDALLKGVKKLIEERKKNVESRTAGKNGREKAKVVEKIEI